MLHNAAEHCFVDSYYGCAKILITHNRVANELGRCILVTSVFDLRENVTRNWIDDERQTLATLNGHNITPSHAVTRELKRYAVLIGLELEHYVVSIEFGKLRGHLDCDMGNRVITRNGKLLKLLVLSISREQKLSLGKHWKKVSKLRIGQNNLENLLPHSAETVK
jgi:hypothetical protein